MSETIKMADMSEMVAAKIMELINLGKVEFNDITYLNCQISLTTDTEPKDLIYPEGWYYAKGRLTNKHNSSTGCYSEIYMYRSDGTLWSEYADYYTLG